MINKWLINKENSVPISTQELIKFKIRNMDMEGDLKAIKEMKVLNKANEKPLDGKFQDHWVYFFHGFMLNMTERKAFEAYLTFILNTKDACVKNKFEFLKNHLNECKIMSKDPMKRVDI